MRNVLPIATAALFAASLASCASDQNGVDQGGWNGRNADNQGRGMFETEPNHIQTPGNTGTNLNGANSNSGSSTDPVTGAGTNGIDLGGANDNMGNLGNKGTPR